ncbi:MAG TPA: ABC transporter substrate-binding protein, partial [Trebonia sp.]
MNGRKLAPAIAAVAIATLAAGCSSGSSSSASGSAGSGSASGNTVDVYSSLPMQGASNVQTIPMVNGMKLALEQAGGKAGKFTVNYTVLDDSTAAAGKWDPAQTAANARKVASDPKAVYYMGEFNSGSSEVSVPILNQAGIPQVSPANTYVGLTTDLPGSAPGEPQKYYPTGVRNYARVVATDDIQGPA